MAGTSGAIRAGKAFIELFADDTKLHRGLRSAQARLQQWAASANAIGNRLTLFGAGALTSMVTFAKIAADTGSQIKDLADQTGLSAEAASTLKFAADQSAGSIEDLAAKINRMQNTIVGANKGSKEAAHALKQIGLSAADLFGLSPDEQFKRIATAISALGLAEERTAATTAIFGKSSADLLPLLLEGADGIEALQAKARALGLELSSEQAKSLEEFGDQWAGVKMQLGAVATQIGSAVIPVLRDLFDRFGPLITATAAWIKANQGVIKLAFAGAAAILGLGIAFKLVAAGITVAQVALAAVAVLLSPSGLIVAGLTAAVVAIGKFAGAGETFKQTWAGIVDAVKAGNLEAAFKIVSLGVQVVWAQMIGSLQRDWNEFVAGFQKKVFDLGAWLGGNIPGWARPGIDANAEAANAAINAKIVALQKELRAATDAAKPLQERHVPASAKRRAIEEGMVLGETSTRGTFNGRLAPQILGNQSLDRQIADNTKKAADLLKKIANKIVVPKIGA